MNNTSQRIISAVPACKKFRICVVHMHVCFYMCKFSVLVAKRYMVGT